MSLLGCTVVAIDGTHNAGKSTLAADLLDHYLNAGLDAALVEDAARLSPLVAAVVDDPVARFTLDIEIDLLAATVTALTRAADGRQVLVVDKTAANVLAYAQLFLTPQELVHPVLAGAQMLCQAWQPYDLVIRCTDQFPIDLAADTYRAKVTQLQAAATDAVQAALDRAGYRVLDLPAGLSPTHRLTWLTAQPQLATLVPDPSEGEHPCSSAPSSTST